MNDHDTRLILLQNAVTSALHSLAIDESTESDKLLIEKVRGKFPYMFNFGIIDVFGIFYKFDDEKYQRLANLYPDEAKIFRGYHRQPIVDSTHALAVFASIP
ncbi:MAG: hypothetical protein K9M11_02830 [Candidatus Pacebacteria bacterium]|nr:hypothetical protein [Candidatus Paceibacterota bacterium]